jgi:soluble lytic murein transglycosylase-like protein
MTPGIMALILAIAAEVGVPAYFALAIALVENPALNPLAVHENPDGTFDMGVMQFNSSWYSGDWRNPETNIRAGCSLIKELTEVPEINTWFDVAICYNAGRRWLETGTPPASSIEYAFKVINKYNQLSGGRAEIVLRRRR